MGERARKIEEEKERETITNTDMSTESERQRDKRAGKKFHNAKLLYVRFVLIPRHEGF